MCLSFSHECIPTTFMKQQLMASFTLGHLDKLTLCQSLNCCPLALWSAFSPAKCTMEKSTKFLSIKALKKYRTE